MNFEWEFRCMQVFEFQFFVAVSASFGGAVGVLVVGASGGSGCFPRGVVLMVVLNVVLCFGFFVVS
jgi:hypothetical protein